MRRLEVVAQAVCSRPTLESLAPPQTGAVRPAQRASKAPQGLALEPFCPG